jgi:hypothetical protein
MGCPFGTLRLIDGFHSDAVASEMHPGRRSASDLLFACDAGRSSSACLAVGDSALVAEVTSDQPSELPLIGVLGSIVQKLGCVGDLSHSEWFERPVFQVALGDRQVFSPDWRALTAAVT